MIRLAQTPRTDCLDGVHVFIGLERSRQWCEYARLGKQSPWLGVSYDVRSRLMVSSSHSLSAGAACRRPRR